MLNQRKQLVLSVAKRTTTKDNCLESREKRFWQEIVLASLTGNIPRPMWKSFQAIWDSANDCDHVDNVKAKFIINQVRIIVGLSSPTLGEIKTK